jgi:Ni,Fe-hydrogenase III small subunit
MSEIRKERKVLEGKCCQGPLLLSLTSDLRPLTSDICTMRRILFESLLRRPLTEAKPPGDDAMLSELAATLDRAARQRLGRSLSIREVDAGSCNGCELEIHALNNAFYDLERFGLRFVASPRHADVLLVTGPVARNMREALRRTYDATPDPKWVVAVGDCAFDGGIFSGSYAVTGGVSAVLPVDLHIRGCPPRPVQLIQGLLALLENPVARMERSRDRASA